MTLVEFGCGVTLSLAASLVPTTLQAADTSRTQTQPQTQTIVLMRHGEKAERGLGQLSCRGLNRALALPARLNKLFGRPDYIFAPDPAKEKEDEGARYSYARPLATIEPTAIADDLPVDATIGFEDMAALERRLGEPRYRAATVVVVWEHHRIAPMVRDLLAAHGGAGIIVPDWEGKDFDSFYVVRIVRDGTMEKSSFEQREQKLDHMSKTCPQPER